MWAHTLHIDFSKSILCIISMSLSIIIEYSIRCPQKLSSLFYRSFALLCSRYGRVYLFSLCCDFTARGFSFYRYPIVQCLFRDGFGKRLYRLLAHIVVRRSTQSSQVLTFLSKDVSSFLTKRNEFCVPPER